jgi:hypothetical protein
MKFTKGQKVRWVSSFKEKVGEYVAFVPANTDIRTLIPEYDQLSRNQIKGMVISTVDRHLIKVPRGGQSVKYDYYMPAVYMGVSVYNEA